MAMANPVNTLGVELGVDNYLTVNFFDRGTMGEPSIVKVAFRAGDMHETPTQQLVAAALFAGLGVETSPGFDDDAQPFDGVVYSDVDLLGRLREFIDAIE